MQNISDQMSCREICMLRYKDKKQNDTIYIQQLSNTQKRCIKDNNIFIGKNSKTIFYDPSSNYTKNSCVNYCPFPLQYKDYLLRPCDTVSYKNYIVFDDHKKCSNRHQLLNNITKRK